MNNSGLNTIILIFILSVVVFAVAWFFTNEQQLEGVGVGVDVSLPISGSSE